MWPNVWSKCLKHLCLPHSVQIPGHCLSCHCCGMSTRALRISACVISVVSALVSYIGSSARDFIFIHLSCALVLHCCNVSTTPLHLPALGAFPPTSVRNFRSILLMHTNVMSPIATTRVACGTQGLERKWGASMIGPWRIDTMVRPDLARSGRLLHRVASVAWAKTTTDFGVVVVVVCCC